MNFTFLKVLLVGIIVSSVLLISCKEDDESSPDNPDYTQDQGEFEDTRDGTIYKWVKLGDQIWMAENLLALEYPNGTAIPLVESISAWEEIGYTDKACCWYDNSTANRDTFGALYTWTAAVNGAASSRANPSGVQGVCPDGWHLPSDAEWTELENYLIANGYNWGGTTTGNKIGKSLASTSGWTSSSEAGVLGNDQGSNNSTGFTVLPGGYRNHEGSFHGLGDYARFWSATEYDASLAWGRHLYYNFPVLDRNDLHKGSGFSVRCIKD